MDEREIYLMPHVTEGAFTELQPMMKAEVEFPRTFGEWQALWDDRRKEEEGNGYNVRFVDVMPAAFAKFCDSRKIPCGGATLGQFITAKAERRLARPLRRAACATRPATTFGSRCGCLGH